MEKPGRPAGTARPPRQHRQSGHPRAPLNPLQKPARRIQAQRTAISQGDILNAPPGWVWKELDENLVRTNDFPRLATEQYYVLYLTNMSRTQVSAMDAALRNSTAAYLGYIDCSTWTPLKSFMLLPQYAIRDGDALVVPADEDGSPHITPPTRDHGFRLVGVEQTLYGVVLEHRMDNGVPEWADEDSALTLTALGGAQSPLSELKLDLDERRLGVMQP